MRRPFLSKIIAGGEGDEITVITPTTISCVFSNQFFLNTHETKKNLIEERKPAFSFNTPSRSVSPKSDSGEEVAMLEPWHLK